MSSVTYTARERTYLDQVREVVEQDDKKVERERDLFLCHAWADRNHAARVLYTALKAIGIDVWFSEEDLTLGASLSRQLDRGIAVSRVGIVLVTPALLGRVS